ncbi:deoxynucleoside kinase [Vagococcus sp.]|uniref:deoxynucleoside kinase n=1 Tax=Vagococcus sp. TaxID=1933889 RepID=UPI003F9EB86A
MKIFISGAVGVGKTTLAELLSRELDLPIYMENISDNEFLPMYYQNPKRYALTLQMSFLQHRVRQAREAMQTDYYIMDRSLHDDLLFFKAIYDSGRTTPSEWTLYQQLFELLTIDIFSSIGYQPDLFIFIDASDQEILNRIEKRQRSFEKVENQADLEKYFLLLAKSYREWMYAYEESPKLIINSAELNFLTDESAEKEIIRQVKEKLNLKSTQTYLFGL